MTDIDRAMRALKNLQQILEEGRESRTETCPECGYHGEGDVYGGYDSPLFCGNCGAIVREKYGTSEQIEEEKQREKEDQRRRELKDRIGRSIVIEIMDYEGNVVDFLVDPVSLYYTRISETNAYGLTISVRKSTKEDLQNERFS